MTDLDARIRAKLDPLYTAPWPMNQYRTALLAVLDVHKPQSAGIPTKPHLLDCAVCLDVGPERCDHVGYPCATVLAIAKALGIEAP